METSFKVTKLITNALTSKAYTQKRSRGNLVTNQALISLGNELIRKIIYDYVIQELQILKFPMNIANTALNSKNLAKVFEILKTKYRFEIYDDYSQYNDALEIIHSKAKMLKALAVVLFVTQREIFDDIINEIKKTIDVEGDYTYKMEVFISNEINNVSLGELFKVDVSIDSHKKRIYKVVLAYNDRVTTGTGYTEHEAKNVACMEWLNE